MNEKLKSYLSEFNIPQSSIEKLLDEKAEFDPVELAKEDATALGKLFAKNNPDPKSSEKYIIDLKAVKAGVFKTLQKLGAEMGELSRNKVEDMDTETFLKSIGEPLTGHIEKVKSSTDEKISTELKNAIKKINELQEETETLEKNFKESELKIRGEVENEKQQHLLTSLLNDLDSKANWGIVGDSLGMIKEAGRSKIASLKIKVDANGNVTNENGGPATGPDGKTIVKNISELHKNIFDPAFKKSNGQPSNTKPTITSGENKTESTANTDSLVQRMTEAGVF